MGGITTIASVLKVAIPLVASATVFAAFATIWNAWQIPVPWWAIALVQFFFCYLIGTACMAWERAKGPSVVVSPLKVDHIPVFYIVVTNGPVPSKVKFKITSAVNSNGADLIERSWEGHWRGRNLDFDGEFSEFEQAQYGLLGVVEHQSGSRHLFIWSREQAVHSASRWVAPVFISFGDVAVTLTVVATCTANTSGDRKAQSIKFHITPDSSSSNGYKITSAKHQVSERWTLGCKVYRRILYLIRSLRRFKAHRRPGEDRTFQPE